jgi:hypothetical protein
MLIHCVDDAVAERTELDAASARSLASWIDEMAGRGVLRHGDRLRPARDATTVRVRDGDVLIADGPFAETKEQVAGYDVIECADLDEAIDVASRHPTARMGTIEVRPFLTLLCRPAVHLPWSGSSGS